MSAICTTTFTCNICEAVLEKRGGYNRGVAQARKDGWEHASKPNKTLCRKCRASGFKMDEYGKITNG